MAVAGWSGRDCGDAPPAVAAQDVVVSSARRTPPGRTTTRHETFGGFTERLQGLSLFECAFGEVFAQCRSCAPARDAAESAGKRSVFAVVRNGGKRDWPGLITCRFNFTFIEGKL